MSSMFRATKTKNVKKDTSVPVPTEANVPERTPQRTFMPPPGDAGVFESSTQRTFFAPPGVPGVPGTSIFAAEKSEEAELKSFDLDLDLGINPKTSTSWFRNPFRKRSRNVSAQPQEINSILGSIASEEREEQQEKAYPEEERKIPTDENNPTDLILSPTDVEVQTERAAIAKFERQVGIMDYAPMNIGFGQSVQQQKQQKIEVEDDDDDYLANLRDLVRFNPNSYGQSYQNEVHEMIEEALRSEKTAPYGRSKLMVVGEGRAGKTCTIRSLLNMVFDAEEASTKGFDVKRVHARNWKEDNKGYLVEQLEKLVNEKKRKENKNKPKIHFTRNHFASMMDIEPLTVQRESSYEDESDELASMASDEAEKFADLRNNQAVDVETEEVQRYGKNFNFSEKKEDTLAFSIWDFGGQKVFYSLHHLFLTEYGCYILVFNVLNLLNPNIKEDTKEYLKFWLFSKKIHAPTAPILIVGTHSDEITHKDIKKLSTILNKEVLSSNYFGEVHNKNLSFFPIDNKTNMGINELRSKVEKVVRKQEYIKRCVPLSFLRVIELLLERDEPYLGINQAKEIVKRCSLDEYFFQASLNFLSQRGLITYFHEHETLRRFVILQPQWLINAITDIIYDENEHNIPKFDNKYSRDFRKFTEERILTKDLLQNIWINKGYSNELQKFLIRIMCRSSLMCNYKFENIDSYLIPSLFTTNVSGIYQEKDEISEYNGYSFVIDFSGNCNTEIIKDSGKVYVRYMPYGFFERVVCLCVEHSALFSDSIKPDIGDKIARLSFGTDIDFEMKVVNNLKGAPLWIKISTEDETEMEDVISLVQNIYSMIDGLRNDFFAKNTETSKLAISLLLPSTPESGSFYADYAELSKCFAKKKLPKFIRPDKAHKKKVKVDCYKDWFPLHEGSTKYENLINPADNLPSPVEQLSQAVQLTSSETLPLPSNLKYHCFLSYKQSSAIDIVGKQYYILSSKGLNCWYDQQHRGTINLESMMNGVKNSMCYVLFLSKDIFPSSYVEAEVKMALSLKKPIILLHHPDTGKVGYWDFGNYINNAPEVVKPLFSDIESIQLQRRHYLEKAVTIEIYNRISKIHKELVQSLI